MDAEQVLRNAGRRSPDLVTLALLLCPAVRIEPELIRAVRLELIPRPPAGMEGELWFSPLVSARGLDGIVLHGDVANLLRDRVRAVLRPAAGGPARDGDPAEGDIRRAWHLIEQMHLTSPPVLRLEETVNWLAVSETDPEPAVEAELQRAVEAFRRGRTGIARWAARALPRMPAVARSTTAAWLLAQGAGRRLASYEGGAQTPDIGRIDDLAALLPSGNDIALGVNRFGDRLDLGDVGRDGGSVRVLDTDPRVLAVSSARGKDEQIIQVPRGTRVTVSAASDAVLLRTARGEVYQVEAAVDDVSSVLRRSCVSVQQGTADRMTRTVGVAVTTDRVLTVLPRSAVGAAVTISGPSGARVTGTVTLAEGLLAVVQVAVPEGVQPLPFPFRRATLPASGDEWRGLTLRGDGSWSAITGVIDAVSLISGGVFVTIADLDKPPAMGSSVIINPLAMGSPVIINGELAGLTSTDRSGLGTESSFRMETVAEGNLLIRDPALDPLPALTSAAQAIALGFHVRFSGISLGSGVELDTDALAVPGLTASQLDVVRRAAEWIIKSGAEVRTQPRWLTESDPRPFSVTVIAALDEASEALRSSGPRSLSLSLSGRWSSLTAAAQQGLAETGVTLVPSEFGGVDARLDAGEFRASGWRNLRGILVEELPRLDGWDPWSPAPTVGADRAQVLLDVIDALCRNDASVPEPARTVLMYSSDHLFPAWWRARDELAQAGVPDIGADQGFPDFLEAYLGWCLTVLDHVRALVGNSRYDLGIAIPASRAAVLPTGRFGLQTTPDRPDRDVRLAGPFASMVGFSAWVFLELADQVRGAAAQPPWYQVLPSAVA